MPVSRSITPPLTIRLFGPFEVRLHGQPLRPLRTRKGEWLFALLTLRHDQPVDRSWLAGTLWPNSGSREGSDNLRRTLTDLRQALGPEAERLQSPTAHTLRLCLNGADVDLLAFDRAVARGGIHPPDGAYPERSEVALASLEQAVSLYRGSLVEGCYEEWVLAERRAREEAYLAALETLARAATCRGDRAAAERYLRLAVAADPLRENAQRALMEVLAARGNYAAALLCYRELRLHLQRQLNAAPDPETTALFQYLRDRAHGQDGRRAAASRESLTPTQPATQSLPSGTLGGSSRLSNLPVPPTPLIGRENEVAAARELLLRAEVRLVTLTGAPGIGKTRLGLAVAAGLVDDFEDGLFFVDLAPLRDPALVSSAIAHSLGVREIAGTPLLESLKAYLRQKQALLLLDNFEHLLAAAPLAAELLAGGAPLKVLVTSRAALHLRGEKEFPVPPLALPPKVDGKWLIVDGPARVVSSARSTINHQPSTISQYAAVELFIQRALDARPNLALSEENAWAVAAICGRLDGLPLAIELAAARMRLFSPTALLSRLDRRLALLTGGPRDLPARHQTLSDAIAWSYDLLPPSCQRLFRRLAVFVGGFTMEAAEAVCSDFAQLLDGVSTLLDKNLLREVEDRRGELRFRMLETIRDYGLECLVASGEEEAARQQHAEFFLALAEEAEPELWRDAGWLDRLESEHDNFRAALDWCFQAVDSGQWIVDSPTGSGSRTNPPLSELTTDHYPLTTAAEMGLRLAGALHWFWLIRGHFAEARGRLEAALAANPAVGASVRGKALCAAAQIAGCMGDHGQARAWGEESLALCRETEDRTGMAWSLLAVGGGLIQPGGAGQTPEPEQALSLFQEIGDQRGTALALYLAGQALAPDERGIARLEESLALCRSRGYRWLSSYPLESLGWDAVVWRGQPERARAAFEESLTIRREYGDRAALMHTLLGLSSVVGDAARATALVEESLVLARESGNKVIASYVIGGAGNHFFHRGQYERATAHLEESIAVAREVGQSTRRSFLLLAEMAQALGEDQKARALRAEARAGFEEYLAVHHERGNQHEIASALNELASIVREQGDHEGAWALLRKSLTIFRELGIQPGVARALASMEQLARAQGDYGAARALLEEGLPIWREMDDQYSMLKGLEGWAAVAVALGQPEGAARLFGTTERFREAFWLPLPPAERAERDRAIAAVRAALGEEDFAAAWAEGQAMQLKQAVAEALGHRRTG
jgi:predicted ATPase/DNA-binding SARP family transcriptional activator